MSKKEDRNGAWDNALGGIFGNLRPKSKKQPPREEPLPKEEPETPPVQEIPGKEEKAEELDLADLPEALPDLEEEEEVEDVEEVAPTPEPPKEKGTKKARADGSDKKKNLNIYVSEEVAEKAKDAYFWEQQYYASFSEFIEAALEKYIKSLEKKRGEPYSTRLREIKKGRPMK